MSFNKVIFVAACLMTTGSAHAQMGGAPQETYIPDVDVESFIWQQPAKWYPYSNATDTKNVTMLFPTGQKPQKFKESLTYTEFNSTLGASSADQVKGIFVAANAKKCTSHNVEEIVGGPPEGGPGGRPERGDEDRPEPGAEGRPEGGPPGGPGGRPENGDPSLENGYSTAMWEEVCEIGKDVQYSLNKVVLGNEKLYTAKKVWKSKPRDSKKEEWLENLRQVYVCDPRTGVNECVPPNGPPGGGRGGPR